jgi:anti-sigma factor ChrR (cupin superfamily)
LGAEMHMMFGIPGLGRIVPGPPERVSEQGRPMGRSYHPSARLRSEYRLGDIAPGAALAVATHLSACDTCATRVQEPPSPRQMAWRPSSDVKKPLDAALPPLLRDIPRGRWRKVSRGVSVASLHGVSGLGEAVCLLRVGPGADVTLPSQVRIVLGVSGSARGDFGELSAGDLIELTAAAPATADPQAGWLALVVGDDGLYRGLFDRLLP